MLLSSAMLILLAACQPARTSKKPIVVTSISIYKDLIEQVTGNSIEVHSMVKGTENPHTFDLSGSKIRLVNSADLLVFNGMGLESWATQIVAGIDTNRTRVIYVADALRDSSFITHGENPHIWMDPRIGQAIVRHLLPALQKILPDSQAVFQQRARAYERKLEQLYQDIDHKLEPLHGKGVIAQTLGLDYFFSAFGIDRAAVIVNNPGTEPSARWMKELVDMLRSGQVAAIVRLPQFSESLPRTLSEESGVPVAVMSPLINGVPYVETYIDLMWFNADALVNAVTPEA